MLIKLVIDVAAYNLVPSFLSLLICLTTPLTLPSLSIETARAAGLVLTLALLRALTKVLVLTAVIDIAPVELSAIPATLALKVTLVGRLFALAVE